MLGNDNDDDVISEREEDLSTPEAIEAAMFGTVLVNQFSAAHINREELASVNIDIDHESEDVGSEFVFIRLGGPVKDIMPGAVGRVAALLTWQNAAIMAGVIQAYGETGPGRAAFIALMDQALAQARHTIAKEGKGQ